MSVNSQEKAARGRWEFFRACRSRGFCTGFPGLHIHVCRTERLRLDEALEKAVRDSAMDGNLPAVAHRSNRRSWKVSMYLDDWLTLCRSWASMEQMLPPDPVSPADAAYPGSDPETSRLPAESLCP